MSLLKFSIRVLSILLLVRNTSVVQGCAVSRDLWGWLGFLFDIYFLGKEDISGTIICSQHFGKPLLRCTCTISLVNTSWNKLEVRRKYIFQTVDSLQDFSSLKSDFSEKSHDRFFSLTLPPSSSRSPFQRWLLAVAASFAISVELAGKIRRPCLSI